MQSRDQININYIYNILTKLSCLPEIAKPHPEGGEGLQPN